MCFGDTTKQNHQFDALAEAFGLDKKLLDSYFVQHLSRGAAGQEGGLHLGNGNVNVNVNANVNANGRAKRSLEDMSAGADGFDAGFGLSGETDVYSGQPQQPQQPQQYSFDGFGDETLLAGFGLETGFGSLPPLFDNGVDPLFGGDPFADVDLSGIPLLDPDTFLDTALPQTQPFDLAAGTDYGLGLGLGLGLGMGMNGYGYGFGFGFGNHDEIKPQEIKAEEIKVEEIKPEGACSWAPTELLETSAKRVRSADKVTKGAKGAKGAKNTTPIRAVKMEGHDAFSTVAPCEAFADDATETVDADNDTCIDADADADADAASAVANPRLRRRLRNRHSAQQSRARRRAHTQQLEADAQRLLDHGNTLRSQLVVLETENKLLHAQLHELHSVVAMASRIWSAAPLQSNIQSNIQANIQANIQSNIQSPSSSHAAYFGLASHPATPAHQDWLLHSAAV
eukprot:TRINITY_DN4834_c0_g1_i3.p1 TRINITY_DN4834_c0_g1~~TRINITY_DN4834_c0_g1_i3.p1  ORF type:complete len:454 (-),score=101.98 TRINITY_DN4834_c0_g1_i3:344-1705(-)